MVLDDASPQAYDTSYQQDDQNVTPTNANSSITQYQIKPEAIVSPDLFTLYFGFAGKWNWQRNLVNTLAARVENARVLVQRPPTQDEMDAFVTHSSRSLYYGRIGAPLASGLAIARMYSQARKTDYYKAMVPGVEEGKLPSAKQLAQGVTRFAKADPTAFRSVAAASVFKLFFWTLTGATMSSIYAVYNDTIATMSDPRLTNFVREVKQQKPEEVRKRKIDAAQDRYRQNQQQMTSQPQEPQQPSEMVPDQASGGTTESHEQQDYSAMYGNNAEPTTSSRSYDRPTTTVSTSSSWFGGRKEQDSVSDFFDDASPTAPEYQYPRNNTTTSQPSQPVFQRGAWERIRQQNTNEVSNSQGQEYYRGQSREWNTQSQRNSGSGQDTEGQREKEQARADFERMLDAERNMSSDDSGNGKNKGWGRWS
ncbi:hypothetical protein SI65_08884 [Aspergillus cristatus]|uniref:Endo-1,3(4)-beta-glucanase n=1 Tax=Aspergillus cristatus TaxID=573508 RepID=A0A1E3B3W8_ASPCR|nr:hypothetical protein SI65_08884 [Aspergillus cristatus]